MLKRTTDQRFVAAAQNERRLRDVSEARDPTFLKLIELRFHVPSLTAPSKALVKNKSETVWALFNDAYEFACE